MTPVIMHTLTPLTAAGKIEVYCGPEFGQPVAYWEALFIYKINAEQPPYHVDAMRAR